MIRQQWGLRELCASVFTKVQRAMLLALVLSHPASRAQDRPQLSEPEAAQYRVADYLGDWAPPALRPSAWQADYVVAQDGSGTHRTVQAALDAVPAKGPRVYIELKPGSYREQLCTRGKAPFTLYGGGADAAAVVIVQGRYNAEAPAGINPCVADPKATTVGTAGSASVALFGDDVQLARLTIANDAMDKVSDGQGYPPGVSEAGGAQAVALMTAGDRIQLEDVRLLGHQDTFYVRPGRVLVRNSLIAGDVDFIFGNAVLVIDGSTLLSRAGRRAPGSGGHVLAPSTAWHQRHGFLVTNSRLSAEPGVAAGAVSLGRAWDHQVPRGEWQAGSSPNGQALVRDSQLGGHLNGWGASTSRRPFAATGPQANRFSEYRNTGPDIGREVLAAHDGWASAEGGTRGGADAAPGDVFEVHDRQELLAALSIGDRPKIIRIRGHVDLSLDANGRRLGHEDFRDPAFDLEEFLKAYDPAVWGRQPIVGPLEDARVRSARRQAAHIVMRVPSNTTIVGLGSEASISGGSLSLYRVDNVIIRNLRLSDAYDHFPAWDPKDNGNGEWNAEYDTITLRGATHVWVDHCSFDDGERPDPAGRVAFGRRMQHHDGLLDMSQQANFVTASWNRFTQHDKTMLIGSSDAHQQDGGRLKVTLHHNLFEQVKERTPRVRWGQVHLYNNLFVGRSELPYAYGYSIGVGVGSRVYSERNAFELDAGLPPERVLKWWKGQAFFDRESRVNGRPADLLAMLREANPGAEISGDVGWVPAAYVQPPDAAEAVPGRVRAWAGAGRL